jgi:hypothetical protein
MSIAYLDLIEHFHTDRPTNVSPWIGMVVAVATGLVAE